MFDSQGFRSVFMEPYSSLALANTFVARHGQKASLTHMKLQKLCFYAYGWWLAYNDEPLLNEGPEVWQYGPVFSSLYNILSTKRSAPIAEPQTVYPLNPPPIIKDDLPNQWIDWVWQRYGQLPPIALSNMTHEIGTPWQIEAAAHNYKVPRHHQIPDDLIRQYFKEEAKRLNAPAA
jgi:uncharacterized phage-associated protein